MHANMIYQEVTGPGGLLEIYEVGNQTYVLYSVDPTRLAFENLSEYFKWVNGESLNYIEFNENEFTLVMNNGMTWKQMNKLCLTEQQVRDREKRSANLMSDTEIIEQLLRGNHLEPAELRRAKITLHILNTALQQRTIQ